MVMIADPIQGAGSAGRREPYTPLPILEWGGAPPPTAPKPPLRPLPWNPTPAPAPWRSGAGQSPLFAKLMALRSRSPWSSAWSPPGGIGFPGGGYRSPRQLPKMFTDVNNPALRAMEAV